MDVFILVNIQEGRCDNIHVCLTNHTVRQANINNYGVTVLLILLLEENKNLFQCKVTKSAESEIIFNSCGNQQEISILCKK